MALHTPGSHRQQQEDRRVLENIVREISFAERYGAKKRLI
jgi:predicted neutral ceramidase superfamily lipid hydrolase